LTQGMNDCDHIIGLGSTPEDQQPQLVLQSQKETDTQGHIVIEKEFSYCPECGKPLELCSPLTDGPP